MDAVSSSHNRLISKLASLADLPVAVHAHRTLNKCKGVIKCRVLVDCYKVGSRGTQTRFVKNINNITVKGNDGNRRITNTLLSCVKNLSYFRNIIILRLFN